MRIICSDSLVSAATAGQTTFDGVTYSTTAENITGLLDAGSVGVNHSEPCSEYFECLLTLVSSFMLLRYFTRWNSQAPDCDHRLSPDPDVIPSHLFVLWAFIC